jgi:hypothetical protein
LTLEAPVLKTIYRSAAATLVLSVAIASSLPGMAAEPPADPTVAPTASAQAQSAPAPAVAVNAFVTSVMNRQYDQAWELLSRRSQDYMIAAVAGEAHMDKDTIAQMFSTNDPRLVNGFWTSFRSSFSKLGDAVAGQTPDQLSNDGQTAVVEFAAAPRAKWTCVFEGGSWHVGYAESFVSAAQAP